MSVHKMLMEEIERRRGGPCAYDEEGTNFLFRLNDHLSQFDQEFPVDDTGDWPVVWVMGCPRTGTTLATQVLCHCLDVGYVDSLAARFWQAPLTGLALSRQILGNAPGKQIDFFSKYAKSDNLASPHEFSYFWHKWLKMDGNLPYDPRKADDKIDWEGFHSLFMKMGNLLKKPLVFKAFDVGFHMERFSTVFPNSLFVYTLRTSIDIAVSLAKGRLYHFGTLDAWWSNCPVEYPSLTKFPWPDQIAAQILHLTEMYERGFERLEPKRLVVLPYSRLCAEPNAFVSECSQFIGNNKEGCGHVVSQLETSFELRRPDVDADIERLLRHALEKTGINPDLDPVLNMTTLKESK